MVAQVTLSLLLLIGAGLFIRSLKNLKDLDPGFQTDESADVCDRSDAERLQAGAQPGILPADSREPGRDPGVESASLAVVPVLAGNEWDSSVAVEGYQAKPGEGLDPHMNFISPDYFKTMNVPILQGRDFRP